MDLTRDDINQYLAIEERIRDAVHNSDFLDWYEKEIDSNSRDRDYDYIFNCIERNNKGEILLLVDGWGDSRIVVPVDTLYSNTAREQYKKDKEEERKELERKYKERQREKEMRDKEKRYEQFLELQKEFKDFY